MYHLGFDSSMLRSLLTRIITSFTLHSEADYRMTSQRAREILRLQEQPVKLHEVCYGQQEPPRRPHGGLVPPIDLVRHCFKEPFGEGSSRNPSDLTPIARVLEAIIRRTLLPRLGYREGLTRLQLWLLNALMQ